MALIMEKEDLRQHMKDVAKNVPQEKLGAYYTNRVIKKYSKAEQDAHLASVIDTILNVPGGYWQIVENMNYMPEFEHAKYKGTLSYEKGNVPKTVAKRELSIKQYAKVYKEKETTIN